MQKTSSAISTSCPTDMTDDAPIHSDSRGEKRFQSLLRWTGLLDRMVNSVDEIYDKIELFQPIDYDKVNARVAAFRVKSLEWLKAALKKMKY